MGMGLSREGHLCTKSCYGVCVYSLFKGKYTYIVAFVYTILKTHCLLLSVLIPALIRILLAVPLPYLGILLTAVASLSQDASGSLLAHRVSNPES